MQSQIISKIPFKKIDKKRKFLLAGVLILITLFLSSFLLVNNQHNSNSKKYTPIPKDAQFIPDEIIIKYKKDYTFDELKILMSKLLKLGVLSQEMVYLSSDDPILKRYYLLKLKKNTDIAKLQEFLNNFEEIDAIEPNYILETQGIVPNDPSYSQLWGLGKIEMENTWDITKGSSSVKVAVVDSGIDYNHVDLPVNVFKGKDFVNNDDDPMDDNGHGTHVAGTIGATTDNGIGVSGINWNVELMAVKVMNASGKGNTVGIVNGVKYAIDNGAKVINLSLGGSGSCSAWDGVINYANNAGAVVVVAAGNSNIDAAGHSPASCNGVITVGSTTSSDSRSSFSNFGSTVEIAAPGSSILSTLPGNRYGSKNGTSMATPHVAGVAALLLTTNPNFTPDQIKDCLVNNADIIPTDKPIGPRLNAFKALTLCTGGTLPINSPTPLITNVPSTYSISINIWIDNNNDGVKDGNDTPYQDAIINLTGPIDSSGTTNVSGDLAFSSLPSGDYSVGIIIPGYNISPYPISIINGSILLTLGLSPETQLAIPIVVTQPITLTPVATSIPTNAPLPTGTRPGGTSPTPTPTPIATYNCEIDKECIKKTGQKNLQFCLLICNPR